MEDNPITQSLRGAVFAHVFTVEGLEEHIKDKAVSDMIGGKDDSM